MNWKEEEYQDFFNELALQKQSLSYSLAIRLEDKDIQLNRPVILPENEELAKAMNAHYEEEYGISEVIAKAYKANLLTESQETIDCIVLSIHDCPTMKLLINIMRIGKKLNVRFYTLYTPAKTNPTNHIQQALLLFKNISPTISIWEKSVKESTLSALQTILNKYQRNESAFKDTISEF